MRSSNPGREETTAARGAGVSVVPGPWYDRLTDCVREEEVERRVREVAFMFGCCYNTERG